MVYIYRKTRLRRSFGDLQIYFAINMYIFLFALNSHHFTFIGFFSYLLFLFRCRRLSCPHFRFRIWGLCNISKLSYFTYVNMSINNSLLNTLWTISCRLKITSSPFKQYESEIFFSLKTSLLFKTLNIFEVFNHIYFT